MGLIKAAIGSAGGILADQWKEFFSCDAIPADVLVCKGRKSRSGRSSNTKGSDNVISSGSVVVVADGQCMMIVDQGKIAEFASEPGEYTYDASTEPSIFCGNLEDSLFETFAALGHRFTFGGDAGRDQRVYYFNTKEIPGNKYGTPSPVPFRVVDANIGLDVDVSLRCFGEYTYRVCDPMLFYKNVCGNVSHDYTRQNIDSQLKAELLTALGPAFARLSARGVRYSALPGCTLEIAEALNQELSGKWRQHRGLEIVSFGISSLKASEEDEAMIKELQRTATLRNPTMAQAYTVGAAGAAMQAAARNEGGAVNGLMGVGMIGNLGGMFSQPQQPAPPADGWQCSCGTTVNGNFCPQCGQKKPQPRAAGAWNCPGCGTAVTGNFCPQCGSKKPGVNGWTCTCGSVNQGRFCPGCGAKKPAAQPQPQYRCDKCGWEPADPTKAPKFCPECGDPFDNGDIV